MNFSLEYRNNDILNFLFETKTKSTLEKNEHSSFTVCPIDVFLIREKLNESIYRNLPDSMVRLLNEDNVRDKNYKVSNDVLNFLLPAQNYRLTIEQLQLKGRKKRIVKRSNGTF